MATHREKSPRVLRRRNPYRHVSGGRMRCRGGVHGPLRRRFGDGGGGARGGPKALRLQNRRQSRASVGNATSLIQLFAASERLARARSRSDAPAARSCGFSGSGAAGSPRTSTLARAQSASSVSVQSTWTWGGNQTFFVDGSRRRRDRRADRPWTGRGGAVTAAWMVRGPVAAAP